MIKLLIGIITIGMITSCNNQPIFVSKDFEVIQIEGCQYIEKQSNGTITHKGNCNNPIHKGGNNE